MAGSTRAVGSTDLQQKGYHMNFGGRLTLTSGIPVTEADVVGASTVYFTPCGAGANLTQIFDGTQFQERRFAEIAIDLSASAQAALHNYPVFALWDGAAVRAGTGPYGAALSMLQGVMVNSAAITVTNTSSSFSVPANEGTFLGLIGIGATAGLTEDSFANRLVGNVFNAVPRPMVRQETTQSWIYDVAQLRQANGNTLNQVAYVQPVSGRKLSARVIGVADNSNPDMVRVSVGIGIDSTTVDSATFRIQQDIVSAVEVVSPRAEYEGFPGPGRHVVAWLECGSGNSDTQKWFSSGISLPTNYASGLWAEIEL
jgi:hypothetical protein